MTDRTLLITLRPSSDVDLGRWLLQHYGVPYTERPHAPIFHVLALKAWGEGKDDYPLLVRNGNRFPTVEKIVALLEPDAAPDRRLLPDDGSAARKEVDALQHYARYDVGTGVVNWSYFHLLQHKAAVWPSITTGVPWYEKAFCHVGFPVIRSLMYKGLALDRQVADKALDDVRHGFDRIDALLADGRRYLVGDRLSLADLATAASFGPMILAQGYQGFLPNQAACPPFMQTVYQELRTRPAGLFVQRLYDTHRPGV